MVNQVDACSVSTCSVSRDARAAPLHQEDKPKRHQAAHRPASPEVQCAHFERVWVEPPMPGIPECGQRYTTRGPCFDERHAYASCHNAAAYREGEHIQRLDIQPSLMSVRVSVSLSAAPAQGRGSGTGRPPI